MSKNTQRVSKHRHSLNGTFPQVNHRYYTGVPCKSPLDTLCTVRSSKLVQTVGKSPWNLSQTPDKIPSCKSWDYGSQTNQKLWIYESTSSNSSLIWHHELICTDCMSSEACVLWSVGPAVGWVCRAEAFNCKQHHFLQSAKIMQDLSCVHSICLVTPIQIHWAQHWCSCYTSLLLTPARSLVEWCDASGGIKLPLCRRIH